ncbi:PKS ER domain-containing protein [Citrus sinensis]|nr:PKS ER domain-containing protein [Citrus sinensis]
MAGEEGVSNKQVILSNYVTGFPKESDMKIITDTVLLKNLYLSCDPYMRGRMSELDKPSFVASFESGEPLSGYGVSKVLDSTHPNYKKDDLVWGLTSWEEFSLIQSPQLLIKILDTSVPLPYYTGILGKLLLNLSMSSSHELKIMFYSMQ